MTKDPKCVRADSTAADALAAMTGGYFRHVPVLAEGDAPPALLDVARLLQQRETESHKLQATSYKLSCKLQATS